MAYNPGTASGGGSFVIGGFGTANQIYLDGVFGKDTGKSATTVNNPSNAFKTFAAAAQYIADEGLSSIDLIVRAGQYAGGTLALQGDSNIGMAIVAEARGVQFTSTLAVIGDGLFEARGFEIKTSGEPAFVLTPTTPYAGQARFFGVPLIALYANEDIDASAVVLNSGGLEIGGENQVQCQRSGTTAGSRSLCAFRFTDGGILSIFGGRQAVFSQDNSDPLAMIIVEGGASGPALVKHVSSFKDYTLFGAASAAPISYVRCINNGGLDLVATGGAHGFGAFNNTSEEVVPVWLDSSATATAILAGELIKVDATPDARTYAAACAQAGNTAQLLGCTYAGAAAEITPGRRALGADAGAIVLQAFNNIGSLAFGVDGKGLRLDSFDGVTTQLVGLTNGGGSLTFT